MILNKPIEINDSIRVIVKKVEYYEVTITKPNNIQKIIVPTKEMAQEEVNKIKKQYKIKKK